MAIDTQTAVLMGMLATISVVALFELRFLRNRRKRRLKATASKDELPDRAHNAILTTKAIRDSLGRGGVRSDEANDAIREADSAAREGNYRVAVELADKARSLLRQAKLRHEKMGDLAKLDQTATKRAPAGEESLTEKERLMKELPPNYMQSKFSMELAQDDIDAAKVRGLNTAGAEGILRDAQSSFDAGDYEGALKHAMHARRALQEAPTEAAPTPSPVAPAATARTCRSCGAPLAADDAFCRRCGTKAPIPRACPSCGAAVADEDAFCRKCGASVPLKP